MEEWRLDEVTEVDIKSPVEVICFMFTSEELYFDGAYRKKLEVYPN